MEPCYNRVMRLFCHTSKALPAPFSRTPFELRIDGELVGTYATYEEARDNAPDWEREGREAYEARCKANWDIGQRIAGRLFNEAFGYRAGTTSTMDLLAAGVPIAPPCISNDLL